MENTQRLYVKITDHERNTYEWVVLVAFDEDEQETGKNEHKHCYMQQVVLHGQVCFKVKIDEGYMVTTYYYPIARYTMDEIHKYY